MKRNISPRELPMEDAMRVKTAELWLEVGQTDEALDELYRLSSDAWKHPWPQTVLARAGGTAAVAAPAH